ncbi:MAG TPA: hypothetical protein DCS93_20185 [Microscillaceae bacterium]|nr:hypothetical protein [Microscillaceae bacterium]
MKQKIQSLSKYLLALLVMAGAWGCASTAGLQNANQDDDDVYFSRKDREQAKIAKETAIKSNPTVAKTTTTVENNNNGNGLEVNPTYGVNKNNQTDVNPEYIEEYRNGNGNSTITQNGITYSGNEYYTETRANNSRVQVPRSNVDTWGNTNNGVFYDPYLDPASSFYNPYASTSNLRFGWNRGWGNNWRYRRWANRYRWYDPYYRNDVWFYRNVWWYGGYGRNNAWCPAPSRTNTIYTNTTRVESRPRRFVNRNPRRSGAGGRGSTIITNNNRVNTKRRASRATTNSTDVNKRAATAGRRYKRTTNNAGKRVKTNSSGRQMNRTSTTRPRRTQTRTRRNSSYSRTRSRSSNFNRSSTRSRSRSTYKRSTSRPSYSKPRSTRTFKRTTRKSSPSRSKRSGGSSRRKK